MIARVLALGLCAFCACFPAFGQASLDNLVYEASADWMLGKWQAQMDNGDEVTLNVSWDLDKHVIVLHVKAGDMEAKGYTVLEPNADRPKYYSFDNKGAVAKGSWDMEGSDLVLRVEGNSPERGTRKSAFVFGGSSSTGLEVRIHGITSYGDLATPAQATLKFKKQG